VLFRSVSFRLTDIAVVQITPFNITLPDFNTGPDNGITCLIQHPPGEYNDLPTGFFNLARQLNQVVIDIAKTHSDDRVKWPFGS
jgi:hypothetical protein